MNFNMYLGPFQDKEKKSSLNAQAKFKQYNSSMSFLVKNILWIKAVMTDVPIKQKMGK